LARRRPFVLRRANPLSAVAQIRRYPNVLGLLFALLLFQIAHDSNPSTFTFFTIEKFHWSPAQIGYAMAAIGTAIAIVQGALIGPVVARLGEKWAVYLGFTLITASFLGYSLATRGWMIYAFTVPLALGTIGTTALKALMSRRVPENSQGELQGAVASLMSLTAVGSPLLMTQLFAHFTKAHAVIYFPGAPFFAAALLSIGCLAVSIYCLHRPVTAALSR
jgi:DHA1 family tetracycline resistance protein-like MFS transporter